MEVVEDSELGQSVEVVSARFIPSMSGGGLRTPFDGAMPMGGSNLGVWRSERGG